MAKMNKTNKIKNRKTNTRKRVIKRAINKRAQVATGMFIFISTILIILIFLAFNILITLRSYAVNQDIKDQDAIFKADQTLVAFTRIPGIERIIYNIPKNLDCKELDNLAQKYIGHVYGDRFRWRLTLRITEEFNMPLSKLCTLYSGFSSDTHVNLFAESRIFSEQKYPLPIGSKIEIQFAKKDLDFLILRLEQYEK